MTHSTNIMNDLMTKSLDCITILTGHFNNSRDITIPGFLQHMNCFIGGNSTLGFFQCHGRLYMYSTVTDR